MRIPLSEGLAGRRMPASDHMVFKAENLQTKFAFKKYGSRLVLKIRNGLEADRQRNEFQVRKNYNDIRNNLLHTY